MWKTDFWWSIHGSAITTGSLAFQCERERDGPLVAYQIFPPGQRLNVDHMVLETHLVKLPGFPIWNKGIPGSPHEPWGFYFIF